MTDEQMDLIDVHGKKMKPVIAAARKYRATIAKRLKLQEKEAEEKQTVSDLIKKLKIKPLPSGLIHFTCDGLDIIVEPGKEKVKVKELE